MASTATLDNTVRFSASSATVRASVTMPLSGPSISKLVFERNASPVGIGQVRPSISWRFDQSSSTSQGWKQVSYNLSFQRGGKTSEHTVESAENAVVPWPDDEPGLRSRERVKVGVRAKGSDGRWTEWFHQDVEAALLDPSDWSAKVISPSTPPPVNLPKRPFHAITSFKVGSLRGPARIYATALGVYELTVNGKKIGDHVLAPGWQSYNHRLHYQTYEVPEAVLVSGDNTIEAVVGEGWWSGRLTWQDQCRNLWGEEIGVQVQVEVDGKVVARTDTDWKWRYGKILSSELYDGETFDAGYKPSDDWQPVKTISLPPSAALIAPEAPTIRRTEELRPTAVSTSPTGKKIIDFGQNLVGWVKIATVPKKSAPNEAIVLRFAEVLTKDGEMGIRPLRSAKATDRIYLGDADVKDWEPTFTTHGFRYCEVSGPKAALEDLEGNYTAVVVHSDMERLGDFECSHELVNKLHRNVVWGLRGNFVGLPTDCPQRDERLGWTGDLQAFAPTASYLYDTTGFLANWLHDLSVEQLKDSNGIVPLVVPNVLNTFTKGDPPAQAVWGDVCVITPKDLYHAFGSTQVLEELWESMTTWFEKGIKKGPNGLWENERNGFQLSDWLDPRAPPDDPGAAMTDQFLVADAYLVHIAQVISQTAGILGKSAAEQEYATKHKTLRKAFQDEYLAPSGRLSSDTQTAYCLAFQFNLLDESHIPGAGERLIRLARREKFRIGTGFAGTPGILGALTKAGHLQVAYRMLQEKGCPSWLYPVTMGATTIWERWDSLLPNGEINPGEMTSFNHYALGAVASWLHTTVAGLRALEPGYKKIEVRPRPGGSLTHAKTHTVTPYGRASVAWELKGDRLKVDFEVPPNTTAIVKLGEAKEEQVGSGVYSRVVEWKSEGEWPPAPYSTQFAQVQPQDTLAL